MRSQLLRHVINVLLFGLFTQRKQTNGFGFNFSPSSPPSIPLQVAANSPFPYASGCGASFCQPPTIILAPSFSTPSFFPPSFPPPFPPPYPPPYPYPPPPPQYPYPQQPYLYPIPDSPSPKQTLFSNLLDAILSKKGKSMPQSPAPPPPPPAQYPPQHSRIRVNIVKDSGNSNHKKQNQHQNHWHEEKPKWN